MKSNSKKHGIFKVGISKKHKGFTLIEIIISFALFAILMGGIYGIIISAMKNNKAGEIRQTAALYGQEVFEDIKSGPIKESDGTYKIGQVSIKDTSGGNKSNFEGSKVFQDGYEAKVTIERNTTIILDKDGVLPKENNSNGNEAGSGEGNNDSNSEGSPGKNTNDYKFYNFDFYVNSNGNQVKIQKKDGSGLPLTLNITGDERVKFSIDTSVDDKKKVVKIKDEDTKIEKVFYSTIKENTKDGGIKLTLNFYGYKFKDFVEENKYKPVEIDVRNNDDIPLNIVLEKPEDLNVDIDNKFGKIKIFDNRSENTEGAISGELYYVTVTIKNKETIEFTRQSSQNIKFN